VSTPTSTPPPAAAATTAAEPIPSVERTSGAFASSPGKPPQRGSRIATWLRKPIQDPDPILLKELRATFRTPGFIRFLYLATALVGLAVVGGGAAMASGNTAPAEAGRNVFQIFFSLLLAVICLVAPGFAATAITSEREAHTYESLILSGMTGTRVVVGKLAAYFASIGLVVVAIAPVVGVAFLFGGISPLAVAVGFAWILMVLGVATAFGIAVSAHVQTTRVAIVITTILAIPTAMMLTSFMTGVGEIATSTWGIHVDGPFWFADAFAQRVDEVDTWALLGFAPLYVFGVPTWFFVASAVAGVVPPSDDRSTALKVWALFAVLLGAITFALPSYFLGGPSDSGEAAVAGAISAMTLLYFIALVLCNEPPLPPALRGKPSMLRRSLAIFGPGAGGTLRFTLTLIVLGAFTIAGTACLAYHLGHPSLYWGTQYDEALIATAVGQACIASCFAALATTIRLTLRSGASARVLSTATFLAIGLVAVTLTTALDLDAIDHLDRHIHPLLALTPFGPAMCAALISDIHDVTDPRLVEHWSLLAVASIGYGMLALAMWTFVEMRVVQARRAVAARRMALEEKLSVVTRPATVPEPATVTESESESEPKAEP
jgi:ABC-type transport system involved in multi-copper enzyme maturation permease subunit